MTGDPETGNPEESAGAEADADAEEAGAEADDPAENDAADEEKSPEELSNEDFFGVSAGQPDRVRLSNEEADPRVWNDITGLFSCSACVFDVSAEGVILSLAGGRQRLVEFSKLSTPDLLYLRELVVARRAELRDGSVSADRLAGPQAAGVR